MSIIRGRGCSWAAATETPMMWLCVYHTWSLPPTVYLFTSPISTILVAPHLATKKLQSQSQVWYSYRVENLYIDIEEPIALIP